MFEYDIGGGIRYDSEEYKSGILNADGGSGSGNWGHAGRPGKRGGSAGGGGKAHRTGTKESGYSSAAKERKAGGSGGSGGNSGSSEGKKESESGAREQRIAKLSKSPHGSTSVDKYEEVWQKTGDDEYINLMTGEIANASDLGDCGAEVLEYTGKTDFYYGRVSKEEMNKRLWEISKNAALEEGESYVSSEAVEEFVGSVKHYGLGGDCQMILSAQDPETYSELRKLMSDKEKEMAVKEAENIEKFIKYSDKVYKPIYRGVGFNSDFHDPKAIQNTLDKLKKGEEISMGHIASWSSNEGTAKSYSYGALDMELESGENYSIVYSVKNPKTAVSLSGINPEGECLSPKDAKYKVANVKHKYDDEDNCHYYSVELEEE